MKITEIEEHIFNVGKQKKFTKNEIKGIEFIVSVLMKYFPSFDTYKAVLAGQSQVIAFGQYNENSNNIPLFAIYRGKDRGEEKGPAHFKLRFNGELDEKYSNERKRTFPLAIQDSDDKKRIEDFIKYIASLDDLNGRMSGISLNRIEISELGFGCLTVDDIVKDIDSIENDNSINETEKEALIKARKGQGGYRKDLIDYWGGCSITKCDKVSLLRASHIKPWRDCNNKERLDKYNGLLLTPNLDLLFDQGFISFDDNGKIIISNEMDINTLNLFGASINTSVSLERNHLNYIKFHRDFIFKKS